jgi:hypothetical protein
MSRVVKIIGTNTIKNIELAQETLLELNKNHIKIENNTFVFEQYDYLDGEGKATEIEEVENVYKKKYQNYLKEKILENSIKNGYKLKKEITKDNKIKLVLQKRVY